MNHEEKIRYSRHISLPEVGEKGQAKLLESKVLVIGAGGLGSPALLYLAASGVGNIGIIDDDKVEISNLQRQVLHETSDVGRKKVESARDAMQDLNPNINITCYDKRLDENNIEEIFEYYDVIADGSDNFETRFLVNKYCHKMGKILVSAAIHGFSGQLAVFKSHLGPPHPCYQCLYAEIPPEGTMPNCSESGVLGPIAGIMGTWQAMEVIKELLGIGESLSGHVIIFDGLNSTTRKVKLPKDAACECCGS